MPQVSQNLVGERVKEARTKAEFTQDDLSQKLGKAGCFD
jgi:ribosome-binding protein aMBF1 (putative translation factor)